MGGALIYIRSLKHFQVQINGILRDYFATFIFLIVQICTFIMDTIVDCNIENGFLLSFYKIIWGQLIDYIDIY